MAEKYARLDEACCGQIGPERLRAIGDALDILNRAGVSAIDIEVLHEYRMFMRELGEMFRPIEC